MRGSTSSSGWRRSETTAAWPGRRKSGRSGCPSLSDYGGGESHVLVVSYPGIELARLPEALAHLAELL